MGEKAINYKAHVAENGRRHVKLFLNTGKKSPFCRKSPFLFDRQSRLKKLVGFCNPLFCNRVTRFWWKMPLEMCFGIDCLVQEFILTKIWYFLYFGSEWFSSML